MKQNINKRFKDYFNKNQLTDEEKEILTELKQDIYKILDAEILNDAKKLRDMLIDKKIPSKQLHNTKFYGNSSFPTLKN